MKRIGYLYDKIVDIENIRKAEIKAAKGKSKQRSIILHMLDREYNILKIHEELKNKTYVPSEYYIFKLYEPKERIISRLPFRDRIVHHAILNILEPVFVRYFISQTYSCIKRRGIHKCLRDVKKDISDKKYCLKLDIRKFYQSVDKEILKRKLKRKFKDDNLLWLLDVIIDSNKEGLPLGNYTSQFFANFFLTEFDRKIKQNFRIDSYFRYADDMVILHDSKKFLNMLLNQIVTELSKINLHISKYRLFPTYLGVDFVGYEIYPRYIRLRKSTKKRFIKMISNYPNPKSIASYYGWIKHCNGINLWNKYISQIKILIC